MLKTILTLTAIGLAVRATRKRTTVFLTRDGSGTLELKI